MAVQLGNTMSFTAADNGASIKVTCPVAFTTISAYHGEGETAAGTLTFDVDGDVGTGTNAIDLASSNRVLVSNAELKFVHVTVEGIVDGNTISVCFS